MGIGSTLKRVLFSEARSSDEYVCGACEATFNRRYTNCVACGSPEIREK